MTNRWVGFNVACFDTSRDTRQSEQMHDISHSALRTFLICLLLLLAAACSGRGGASNAVIQQPNEAWFCQIDETGEAWDCVRDDELARSPVPLRMPRPPDAEPIVEPVVEATLPEPAAVPELTAESAPAPAATPAPAPVVEPVVAITPPESAAEPQLTTAPTIQPKYLSLAYQPETKTELSDLPADLFVVQLLAMDTPEGLTSFLDASELNDLTGARVEKDGELFYVLILGVYESEAIARDASAELPDALAGTQPWIRKLSSLQTAMIRANDLVSPN